MTPALEDTVENQQLTFAFSLTIVPFKDRIQ